MLFNCFWTNNVELACAMRDWRSPEGHVVNPAHMEEGALGSTCDGTSGPTGNLALLEVFIQWARPNGMHLDIMDPFPFPILSNCHSAQESTSYGEKVARTKIPTTPQKSGNE